MNGSSLRWQCRRGMRELDDLLLSYLERHYAHADREEQKAFERLLQAPDDLLWEGLVLGLAKDFDCTPELIKSIRHSMRFSQP